MKKLIVLLYLMVHIARPAFTKAQHDQSFFLELNRSSIQNEQFDFASISEKVSGHDKVNCFLDKFVLRDTNSIFYYTGFGSYRALLKARQQPSSLYENIDTAEINANMHFLDLNQDGSMDCVYDRIDLSYDYQSIEVLLGVKSKCPESILIPGFLITHFWFDGKIHFGTYAWACCEDPFRHYRKLVYEGNKLLEHVYYHIPRRMTKPEGSLNYLLISINEDATMYLNPQDDRLLEYNNEEVILNAPKKILAIAHNDNYLSVIGEFNQKEDHDSQNKIVGWIKK